MTNNIIYSKEVMEHFMHPKNMGEIKHPDGIGKIGNPICGDIMWIYINVDKNERIKDIKFKTFGCAAAIATASMLTVLAKGKKISEAEKLTMKDIAKSLKGLPPLKMHCSDMAINALRLAIKDYEDKNGK
ncbi:MAG TPA: iron-sulfur cluster assembly scaffold protein [Candidatus Nanoarchaeia archaeon]|nr:iron-sulfur cluster assembly scaffold protein [Candidatus Nanoarchaeia archaeon]